MSYHAFHSRRRPAMRPRLLAVALLAAACRIADQTAPMTDISEVLVFPDTVSVTPGQSVQFEARGRTPSGETHPVKAEWSATGGTIDVNGLYTADTTPGGFDVTATVGHLTGRSRVKNRGALKRVVLDPPADTIPPGAQLQFTTIGVTAGKDTVAVSVVYAATGGTITSSGMYAAGSAPGLYRVMATQSNGTIADTSQITISGGAPPPPPPPVVASVTVSPVSASVVAGATQQLQAVVKDSSGTVLTGRTVTWSSSSTAIASVNATGLVSGVAAGSATITATSEGHNGTSAITVTAAPPAAVASV